MEPGNLWRSFDEPASEGGEGVPAPLPVSRRDFLKLAGAAAALASAGCQPPAGKIVAAAHSADEWRGETRYYATAMALGGSATGLLVASHEGRPTKVEGNPLHPESSGATDLYSQASVLQLWDPARSRLVRERGSPATRPALEQALRSALASCRGGEGVRILTRYNTSDTFKAQVRELAQRMPGLRWHVWEPLHRDRSLAGARLAFDRPVSCVYRFREADVILSLDADPVGSGPGHLRHALDVAERRRPAHGTAMSRLYAVESTPTLTGAISDRRLALDPARLALWLAGLRAAFDAREASGDPTSPAAVARELRANAGRAIVVAGESLAPEAHALVHEINSRLGAPGHTVTYVEPIAQAQDCGESIAGLARDLEAGQVGALLIIGGNPAYDAPADLGFGALIARAAFSAHLSLHDDETSARCTWHVPEAHFLEQWSDARAHDGTASIVQPLIAPLTGGVSAHELLAMMLGGESLAPYERVREQWLPRLPGTRVEDEWKRVLRDGVVGESAAAPLVVRARHVAFKPPEAFTGWSVALREDPSVRDGEFANNAWLQEIPRPHSKITWDNAVYASPASALRLGAKTGDVLDIVVGERRVRAPLWVLPGQADGTLTMPLGYGRTRTGPVGNGVGFDAYPLRTLADAWVVHADSVRVAHARHVFATTQNHSRMEGREPVRRMRLDELVAGARLPDETPRESLYPAWPYDGYRWAMAIDLAACIGCNACTLACQAENNIPTVGKDEVARGREMHWIRVDRYYEGPAEAPRTFFQPVPCMHCEDAPCELVCPVGATMHDSDGLNVQVYNRCVGTRFCSQNCPYKVRRFNFLAYSSRAAEPPLEARNPEVTVRMRGVMEKCNYCQQRIVRARIAADKEARRLEDGEVVTACQAACPTRAITFGDLNDPRSAVNAARASPRNYTLLAELNTRPRTTYLAKVIRGEPEEP
jgi:Fe-S-cluster-containing dehydrogenase component